MSCKKGIILLPLTFQQDTNESARMNSIPRSLPVSARLTVTALLLSALMLSGCNDADSTATPAQTGAPQPEVGVVEITPHPVTLDTELSGRTAAHLIAEVRPQVGGIILERQFEEGSEVKAGQVLYRIDPATYQAAYDLARATLARDEATVTTARLKADRYKELVKIQAVSQEDYDDAAAALKQARATVAMDKASVETARIELAYTRVTAPIDGRIGRSAVTRGALVTADQDNALATIQQLDPIYVDVTQASADLLRLKRALASGSLQRADELEANVELILEDGTRYGQRGRLQFSEVSVDERTGTVTLRAVFPNPQQELLPGMYVRARLIEGNRQAAILAPQQAVTHDTQGRPTALVLNADDTVELRNLTVERALGNQWLVTDGLQAGDRLIVDGLQKVQPGAQARAVVANGGDSAGH